MLKVYSECCQNCLLSPDAIVSPDCRKQIVDKCIEKQTHFFCHKSTMKGEKIICKTFYDKFGQHSQMVRIAERLNMVEFVPQPNHQRLPSYSEMNKKS